MKKHVEQPIVSDDTRTHIKSKCIQRDEIEGLNKDESMVRGDIFLSAVRTKLPFFIANLYSGYKILYSQSVLMCTVWVFDSH
jgi:hypothetical protein